MIQQGRILKEDVERYIAEGPVIPSHGLTAVPPVTPAPSVASPEDRVVPIRGITRSMVKTMIAAHSVGTPLHGS